MNFGVDAEFYRASSHGSSRQWQSVRRHGTNGPQPIEGETRSESAAALLSSSLCLALGYVGDVHCRNGKYHASTLTCVSHRIDVRAYTLFHRTSHNEQLIEWLFADS